MEDDEVLKIANEITAPFDIEATIISDDLFSVGVQGDGRTYSKIIELIPRNEFPSNEVLRKIANEISNRTPINRVTVRI